MIDMPERDAARESIVRGNEERLDAYDRIKVQIQEVQVHNNDLIRQVNGLLEEVRGLRGEIANKDTLISDLQDRESALTLAQGLHAAEREVTMNALLNAKQALSSGFDGAKYAVDTAIESIEHAIANEVAGKAASDENLKRIESALKSPEDRQILRGMEKALTGTADQVSQQSPPIVPEDAEEGILVQAFDNERPRFLRPRVDETR